MKGELESLTDALWAEDFPTLKNYLSEWQKAHPDADVYAWAEALNTSGTLMGVRFGQSHLSLSDLIHLLDQSAIDLAYVYKVPMDQGVLYCFWFKEICLPYLNWCTAKGTTWYLPMAGRLKTVALKTTLPIYKSIWESDEGSTLRI